MDETEPDPRKTVTLVLHHGCRKGARADVLVACILRGGRPITSPPPVCTCARIGEVPLKHIACISAPCLWFQEAQKSPRQLFYVVFREIM